MVRQVEREEETLVLWLANVCFEANVPNTLLHSLWKNDFVSVPFWSPFPAPILFKKQFQDSTPRPLWSLKDPC